MAGPRREVKKIESNYDIVLVMLVILLSIFGLVMIYSSSYYKAAYYEHDAKKYFNQQGKYLLIGLAMMIIISMIDYRVYIAPIKLFKRFNFRLIWLLYIVCLFLQTYVLINGSSAGGSSRWIQFPIIGRFQPSEATKLCFVLFVAFIVQTIPKKMNSIAGFLAVGMYMLPLLILVAVQNLTTAVILAGIMTVICFVMSRNKRYYVIVFLLFVAFVAIFVLTSDYRGDRIAAWRHPETMESGSQILQGLYAIASGGFWGKGLGESVQKLSNIPEVHTDMIFTVICEELGIFGAIMVIAIFLMLFWRILVIAVNAPDKYGCLVATGSLAHIAIQVLLNIAVVTASMPATGVPLPFISYGGSSLLVLMCEMGVVLSVSKYTNKDMLSDESKEQ